MIDRYRGITPTTNSPAIDAFAIAPNDGADLVEVPRAIYVGQGGTITAITREGSQVTLENVPAGTVLPIRLRKVFATGTSAQSLVGFV
ncbi:hypothetical protein ACFE33_15255 (plasmid) [Falsihalocynthiibacter sp. SS001]|uniref:spike base protein, RCAP_Rcc01079 family n=1 Tax=Falsihalocynthiibacter sp. SS001 TaxID=3349698 RepID=UPI0036D2FFF7